MYLSEVDGDYYRCACGDTLEHSYLLSSSDNYITDCCKKKGWLDFEYRGIVLTKKPDETVEERKYRSDSYYMWLREGMPGYKEGITKKEIDRREWNKYK